MTGSGSTTFSILTMRKRAVSLRKLRLVSRRRTWPDCEISQRSRRIADTHFITNRWISSYSGLSLQKCVGSTGVTWCVSISGKGIRLTAVEPLEKGTGGSVGSTGSTHARECRGLPTWRGPASVEECEAAVCRFTLISGVTSGCASAPNSELRNCTPK